jgi:hypothetical protein
MSLEFLYNADTDERRAIQSMLRQPMDIADKKPKEHQIGPNIYVTVDHDMQSYAPTYYVTDREYGCKFYLTVVQYPSCCGVSILHNFHYYSPGASKERFAIMLELFMEEFAPYWQPNIQFIAVNSKISSFDEEEDDIRDLEFEPKYNFHYFVDALIELTDASELCSFINTNSYNTCTVFQFVNKYKE